jgi:hypothetical protein
MTLGRRGAIFPEKLFHHTVILVQQFDDIHFAFPAPPLDLHGGSGLRRGNNTAADNLANCGPLRRLTTPSQADGLGRSRWPRHL